MSQLFGVPVPDGAVKATIKPLLGRGQTKAMWSGPIEKDGIAVDECDIVSDVSDNAAFWQYVDLQVQAKRITAKSDGVWLFRLIVIFEDQNGVKTEGAHSTEEVEFMRRSSAPAASATEQMIGRILGLLEKQHDSTMAHSQQQTSAGLKAIEETAKAAGQVISAAQAPLVALIESQSKTLEAERDRYDSSIKLNMRMLESKKDSNVFDDIAKLAPFAPFAKPILDKLMN